MRLVCGSKALLQQGVKQAQTQAALALESEKKKKKKLDISSLAAWNISYIRKHTLGAGAVDTGAGASPSPSVAGSGIWGLKIQRLRSYLVRIKFSILLSSGT